MSGEGDMRHKEPHKRPTARLELNEGDDGQSDNEEREPRDECDRIASVRSNSAMGHSHDGKGQIEKRRKRCCLKSPVSVHEWRAPVRASLRGWSEPVKGAES